MSGAAQDLDALAEARLDGDLDDAAWTTLVATHGDSLMSALVRAAALRGAVAGLERPALPENVRAAVVAAATSAAAPAPARVAAPPPLRFPWRAVVPAALAASLIVALLATLVVPWRAAEPAVARGEPAAKAAAGSELEKPYASEAGRGVPVATSDAPASRIARGGGDGTVVAKKESSAANDDITRVDVPDEMQSDEDKDTARPSTRTADATTVAQREAAVAADSAAAPSEPSRARFRFQAGAGTTWRRGALPAKPGASAPTAPAAPPAAVVVAGEPQFDVADAATASTDGEAGATSPPATVVARERMRDEGSGGLAANGVDLAKRASSSPAPVGAASPAPADTETDEALIAQARRFVAENDQAPTTLRGARASGAALAEQAPGPLALDLTVVDAAQGATFGYASRDAAKADAKSEVATRVLLVRITNRTVGVAPLPGGAPSLRGLDAAGTDVWSAPLHPTAQTVPADSEIHWQEPATGPLAPPRGVQMLRAQWGTLRSRAVPWTPAP